MWHTTRLAMVVLAFGSGAFAWMVRGPVVEAGVRRLQVTGVVVSVPDGRVVRIAHDDIADYMPAMTMAFTLADGEPARLGPGDTVRFLLRVGSGPSVAEQVTVTGHTRSAAAAVAPVARLKRGDTLPPFTLLDEEGRTLTDAHVLGHPTLVNFVFTRCPVPELCPLATSRFTALQRAIERDRSLPRDAQLLSITLDPAFDTPAVLEAYARSAGASPARWRFATGDAAAVLRVARAFSVFVEKNGALLDHTLATALIDRRGRVVEIWRGNGWQVEEVTARLRRSVAEPSPTD
jgi:protein SCO1